MESSCAAQSGVVNTLLSSDLPGFFGGFGCRNDSAFFADGTTSFLQHPVHYGDAISHYDYSMPFRYDGDPSQLFSQIASTDCATGLSSDANTPSAHYSQQEDMDRGNLSLYQDINMNVFSLLDTQNSSIVSTASQGRRSSRDTRTTVAGSSHGFETVSFSTEQVKRKRAASNSLPPECRDLSPSLMPSGGIALGLLASPNSSPELSSYLQRRDGSKLQVSDNVAFPFTNEGGTLSPMQSPEGSVAQGSASFGSMDTLPNRRTGASMPGTMPGTISGTMSGTQSLPGSVQQPFGSVHSLDGSPSRMSRCPPNLKRYRRSKHIDDQEIVSPSDFDNKDDIVAYVEYKLETMEESFTFKSATYQTHLKRFLPRPDDKQRKYIERIDSFPRIPASLTERRELLNLRKVDPSMAPDSRLGDCREGFTIKERLDEMLTSLVNKIMFLLVVKFDTWYIHAPAREQIREQLLEFIWPNLPELHVFFREHFTFFIDMRIRHFRDSVARYFRDRPRPDGKGMGFPGMPVQTSLTDSGLGGCVDGNGRPSLGAGGMFASMASSASGSLQGTYILPSMDSFDLSRHTSSHEENLNPSQCDGYGNMSLMPFGSIPPPALNGLDGRRVSPIAAGSPVDMAEAGTPSTDPTRDVTCTGLHYSAPTSRGGGHVALATERSQTACDGFLSGQTDAAVCSSADTVSYCTEGDVLNQAQYALEGMPSSANQQEGYGAFTFPEPQQAPEQPPSSLPQRQATQQFIPYFTSSPSATGSASSVEGPVIADDGRVERQAVRFVVAGKHQPGQGLVLGHPVSPKAIGKPDADAPPRGSMAMDAYFDSAKPYAKQVRSMTNLPVVETCMSGLRSPMLSYHIQGAPGTQTRRAKRRLSTPTHFMSSMPPLMPMTTVALSHTGSAALRPRRGSQRTNGPVQGAGALEKARGKEPSMPWQWVPIGGAGTRTSGGTSGPWPLLPEGKALLDKNGDRKAPQPPPLVGPLLLPLPSGYLSSLVSVNSQVDSFPMSGALLDSRRVS